MGFFTNRINTMLAMQAWDAASGGGSTAKPTNILVRGNSNAAGFIDGDPYGAFTTNGYSERILYWFNLEQKAFLGYTVAGNKVDNRAKPARRWQELIALQQDGSEFEGYDPAYDNVMAAEEKGNASSGTEFTGGVAENWVTPEQNLALAKQYHQAWEDKYPGIKQVAATDTPRSNRPYNPDAEFDQEKLRQNGNRLYRDAFARKSLRADALVDFGADGPLGAPWASENLYGNFYRADGVHFTPEGADRKARLLAYAIMKAKYPGYTQPALAPIPNVVTAVGRTEEDFSTRYRSAGFQLGVTSPDFSAGKVNLSQGPDDGTVFFQEATTLGQFVRRAPLSENGGPEDYLVNGLKVATASTYQAGDVVRDQAIYTGQAPTYTPYANGAYVVRYVKRGASVFFEDDIDYSAGTAPPVGGKVATPTFKAVPTDDGGTLTWGNVGADTYTIQESQNANSFPSGVGIVYSGSNLTTSRTGLIYRANYYYKIVATKAGSTASDPVIIKMTPGSPASKPPAVDQNGLLLDIISTAGITKVGVDGVSPWADVLRNFAFSTGNEIKPTFLPSDPAYNGQPTVLFYSNTDFGTPTNTDAGAPTDLAALQEFDLYIGAGVPDGNTQVLLSNRINGNSWWSVNSNQVQLGPDLPLNFNNPNYGKAFVLLVKFRANKVTVELNGVQVAERDNPASFTNPNKGILMAFQFDGAPVNKSTCSVYRAMITQPRGNSQRLNDYANFFYDLAI